jgi:hypothetical protein
MSVGVQAQTPPKPSPKELAAGCIKQTKNPLECFVTTANVSLFICQLEAELAALSSKPYTCDTETVKATKPYFDPALASVAKNKAASDMLKDFYASWQSALRAMTPGQSETKREYHARVEETARKVEERGNRLLLER